MASRVEDEPQDTGPGAETAENEGAAPGPARTAPAAAQPAPTGPATTEQTDPAEEQRDRAEGQPGPGLEATTRIDPTVATAWVLVVVGYTPIAWVEGALGFAYFGPLAWPAIVAMVGVLFAVIALLRSLDLGDRRLRAWALGALVVGLVRVLLFPFF